MTVKCVNKELRFDKIKRHVETLLQFKTTDSNNDKSTANVHFYHTNQKITIQGRNFKSISNNFFEPYLNEQIKI